MIPSVPGYARTLLLYIGCNRCKKRGARDLRKLSLGLRCCGPHVLYLLAAGRPIGAADTLTVVVVTSGLHVWCVFWWAGVGGIGRGGGYVCRLGTEGLDKTAVPPSGFTRAARARNTQKQTTASSRVTSKSASDRQEAITFK